MTREKPGRFLADLAWEEWGRGGNEHTPCMNWRWDVALGNCKPLFLLVCTHAFSPQLFYFQILQVTPGLV